MSDRWIQLGHYVDDWGNEVSVGLPAEDFLVHANVVGTTGSGKSTFLANLALQAFMLGMHVVIIEPHGDLILHEKEGVLTRLPDSLLGNAMVMDLTSPWPPQINLAGVGLGGGDPDLAVSVAMNSLRAAEDAGWDQAIMMRERIEHGLQLLLNVYGKQAAMIHLQRFIQDNSFRGKVLERASDGVMESRLYWDELHGKLLAMAEKGKSDPSLEVPIRRVGKFLRDKRFLYSLALPNLGNEIRLKPMLAGDQPRMFLVPLQTSTLGEEAKRVFGSLFMQMVASAFMSRTAASGTARRQVFVIIDEFADMAGGAVGDIVKTLLAQARKFGASVILATQFIAQLPTDVKQEVKGNTNVKIFLLTQGKDDAREASETLGPNLLTPADIQGIERFHGYARVMVNKQPQPPFYFRAMPPIWPPEGRLNGQRAERRPPPPMLAELHALAARNEEEAITRLQQLDEEKFRKLVDYQLKYGHYIARSLAIDPTFEPDPVIAGPIYQRLKVSSRKVRRALAISNGAYGIPRFFLEAYYRRLRF